LTLYHNSVPGAIGVSGPLPVQRYDPRGDGGPVGRPHRGRWSSGAQADGSAV